MARAVISTIGRDRPGLVNELAQTVLAEGVSIEDSRMVVLGGEFAVLMSVVGSMAALGALDHELTRRTSDSDIAYLFRRTEDRRVAHSIPYHVRVVAMDHPGIVHGVANFFSARNINIRELETETERAAHTGTPIFNLSMLVEIPHGTKVSQLRNEFEAYCDERNLDGAMTIPM